MSFVFQTISKWRETFSLTSQFGSLRRVNIYIIYIYICVCVFNFLELKDLKQSIISEIKLLHHLKICFIDLFDLL